MYLNNCTCYYKMVCTILFSSRWLVYWYELFSVLSTLQNRQKFDKTPKRKTIIFTNFGYFFITWNIECAVDSEWTDIFTFIVSCLIVELVVQKVTKISLWLNRTTLHKQLCFWQTNLLSLSSSFSSSSSSSSSSCSCSSSSSSFSSSSYSYSSSSSTSFSTTTSYYTDQG